MFYNLCFNFVQAVTLAVEGSRKNPEKFEKKVDEEAEENENAAIEQFSVLPVPNKSAKSPEEVFDLYETLGLTQAEFDRYTLETAKEFAIVQMDTIQK